MKAIGTVVAAGAVLFLIGELADVKSLALIGLAVWAVGGAAVARWA